jgi:hypothetical protein
MIESDLEEDPYAHLSCWPIAAGKLDCATILNTKQAQSSFQLNYLKGCGFRNLGAPVRNPRRMFVYFGTN